MNEGVKRIRTPQGWEAIPEDGPEERPKDTGLLSPEAGLRVTLQRYRALAREAAYMVTGKVLAIDDDPVPEVIEKYIDVSQELKAARTVITELNNNAAMYESDMAHLRAAYRSIGADYDELVKAIRKLAAEVD